MQQKKHETEPDHAAPQPSDFDDVVVVPKGQSKLRFFVLLALTIIVLLIFTVGDMLMQSVGGGGRGGGDVFMVWNDPVAGERRVDERTFMLERRNLDDYYTVQGMRGAKRELAGDDAVAKLIILDRLAQNAGVEISSKELGKAILEGFQGEIFAPPQASMFGPSYAMQPLGSAQLYKMSLERAQISAPMFETTLRRVLRAERYAQLMRALVGNVEPAKIEEIWKDMHQQYAFDYVELPVASLEAEAAQAVPADPELNAWYEQLPNRMAVFSDLVVPEKRSADLVAYRFGGQDSAEGLLAKFPRPADRDVDAEARSYYDAVRDRRFRRAEPLTDPAVDEPTRLYQPFEEVAETAKREAPVLAAMRDWLADLDKRAKAGETLDLAKEAAELGLFHQTDAALRTTDEWKTVGGLYTPFLVDELVAAQITQSNLVQQPHVGAEGIAIARVKEKATRTLPPLVDARERVAKEWVKKNAAELALAKLNAIRDALPKPEGEGESASATANPKADAAAFASAVEAQGLKVAHRDFADRMPPRLQDPAKDSPAEKHFQTAFMLYNLEDGDVAAPELDAKSEHAYLIRFAGKRAPEQVAIEPQEYEFLRMRAGMQAAQDFEQDHLSLAKLVQDYGLKLKSKIEGVPEP